jgi:hypothetical protein
MDIRGRHRKYEIGHNLRGRRGEQSPAWKSGRRRASDGYWLILLPDHPQANHQGYVMEHRLVYELYAETGDCCILPWVSVHHRNGIKDDNRPKNLMLVLKPEHMKIHNPRQDFGAICQCGPGNEIAESEASRFRISQG